MREFGACLDTEVDLHCLKKKVFIFTLEDNILVIKSKEDTLKISKTSIGGMSEKLTALQ